jgi:hypothetical protein
MRLLLLHSDCLFGFDSVSILFLIVYFWINLQLNWAASAYEFATTTIVKLENTSNIEPIAYNLTAATNQQVSLPCFVEHGRKFIWMSTRRDEILSIDKSVITSDVRFSVESRDSANGKSDCQQQQQQATSSIVRHRKRLSVNSTIELETKHGCWMNLIISSVNAQDQGYYLCQIDTMSSTRVYLNVLGKLNLP